MCKKRFLKRASNDRHTWEGDMYDMSWYFMIEYAIRWVTVKMVEDHFSSAVFCHRCARNTVVKRYGPRTAIMTQNTEKRYAPLQKAISDNNNYWDVKDFDGSSYIYIYNYYIIQMSLSDCLSIVLMFLHVFSRKWGMATKWKMPIAASSPRRAEGIRTVFKLKREVSRLGT